MSLSAGTITLDLVIKEKLDEQLGKIRRNIERSFSEPMEQAADITQKSMEKAAESGAKAVKENYAEASKSVSEDLDKMIKDASKVSVPKPAKVDAPKSAPLSGGSGLASDELKKQGVADPITEGLSKGLSEARAETDKLHEKMKTVGEFVIPADPVERLKAQLENTKEKIGMVQARWQELQSALESAESDEEAAKLASQLNGVEKQLIGLQSSAENTEQKINRSLRNAFEPAEKETNRFKTAFSGMLTGIKTSAAKGAQSFKSSFGAAFSAVKNLGSKSFNFLKSVGTKAVSALKNKFSGLKGSVDGLNKPFSRLGQSIKSALKSTFLMAGLYAAFRGIKSALSEACEGNEEFAKSLNEIKANLNIAFQPILSAVMPAINTLMSGLAQAAKALATFTSELFGSTYEKSLETVKKVKEVGKEAQKNSTYLASFDEMNVAQDTSSESSSDSSDESGIDYSALDGKGVELPDWAERMKEAIRSGDWNGVGKLLGERVNAAVSKINWTKIKKTINGAAKKAAQGFNGLIEGIDWKKLGAAAGEGVNTVFGGIYTFMTTFDWTGFGSSIAEFLNSSIKTADWGLIGRTFASSWNAVIDTAYAFVTGFDWSGFGLSIGESVNAWFDEIDFAKAGETLSAAISGVLDTAITFLQTVDWQGIGEKVWTFLKSIDWSGIVSRLFELIGSAIGAAVSLLWGFIKDAVFSIRDYFREQIEDCGGNIVEGLFMGIGGALVNLGTWIKDNVFTPFLEGFKKCFGIHSPSTVMSEQGGFIMSGLLGGVSAKITAVTDKFKEVLKKIKAVFTSVPQWFKKKFKDAWDKVTEVFDLDTVKEHFTKIKDKIVEIFGGLKDALKEPFNLVIDLINNVIDKINSFSIDVPDWVTDLTGIETFGFDIPNIPRLATGGLATAPTLAMVGDNPRARTDPEAILPVSKLQEMLDGGNSDEAVRLLREILETLRSLDLTLFATVDKKVLFKLIQDTAKQYKRQTGRSAFE